MIKLDYIIKFISKDTQVNKLTGAISSVSLKTVFADATVWSIDTFAETIHVTVMSVVGTIFFF